MVEVICPCGLPRRGALIDGVRKCIFVKGCAGPEPRDGTVRYVCRYVFEMFSLRFRYIFGTLIVTFYGTISARCDYVLSVRFRGVVPTFFGTFIVTFVGVLWGRGRYVLPIQFVGTLSARHGTAPKQGGSHAAAAAQILLVESCLLKADARQIIVEGVYSARRVFPPFVLHSKLHS